MLKALLWNRFTITLGAVALAALAWNVYIAFNDDGVLAGRVVGPDDAPVEGAEVVLSERSLLVSKPRARTVTDAEGRFVFAGHDLYRAYVEAAKEGVGRQPPIEVRLYFRGQNARLDAPLRLAP